MPTKAASCATAPRIRSTSAVKAASASGNVSSVMELVEPRLKNDLCGHLVASRTRIATAAPRGAQILLGHFARPPLVDERDRYRKARVQLADERTNFRRHRMRCAVRVHRKAHHQVLRQPLTDQRFDRGETR